MNAAAISRPISRRRLVQGAAVGAGAVALAGCAVDHRVAGDVAAARVRSVPLDPDHERWSRTPELEVALGPQDMALPLRLSPAITSVRVRALHDGNRIGFRLEWDDPDVDDLTVRVDDFRDACAVLLAPGPAVAEIRTMGTATTPATLLHWKADWQRDVDAGRQGLEAMYPNRSVDVYPPLWDVAPAEVDIDSYRDHDATVWLPGVHVENPISVAGRTTPVEKAIAYGFSTTTTGRSQDAEGHGVRTERGWRVVITKPLEGADDGELSLDPRTRAACAFAVWSGAFHDAGSRKAPSIDVYSLAVEG
jgi:DMSO reductase family type II enzyme heme b subunit